MIFENFLRARLIKLDFVRDLTGRNLEMCLNKGMRRINRSWILQLPDVLFSKQEILQTTKYALLSTSTLHFSLVNKFVNILWKKICGRISNRVYL